MPADQAYRVARHAVNMQLAVQDENELAGLLELVWGADSYLELGSQRGGSFYALGHACAKDALGVSVSAGPDEDPYAASLADLLLVAPPAQTIRQIPGNTSDPRVIEIVTAIAPPGGYEVLFIDADHHYDAVKRDHENYAPLVRPGGIVALHDICREPGHQLGCEVGALWRELRPTLDEVWEFVTPGSCFGVGAYRVPSPRSGKVG